MKGLSGQVRVATVLPLCCAARAAHADAYG